MTELTPELNLIVGEDDDDTADYLTLSLADSLRILDGLFNATTGHAHNGSHQGGSLAFDDMTITGDVTIAGALAVTGSTQLGLVTTSDLANLNSLEVQTTSLFKGAVTTQSTVLMQGAVTVSAPLTTSSQLNIGGSGAYIKPYAGDATYVQISQLTVTPGATALASLTVNGPSTLNGAATINANLNLGGQLNLPSGATLTSLRYTMQGGASVISTGSDRVRILNHLDLDYDMVVGRNLQVNGTLNATGAISDPRYSGQVTIGGASVTLPEVAASLGRWRYVKAWGQNMRIDLTNGTLIVETVQYSSGQFTLLNGESLSLYCEGANWWVM